MPTPSPSTRWEPWCPSPSWSASSSRHVSSRAHGQRMAQPYHRQDRGPALSSWPRGPGGGLRSSHPHGRPADLRLAPVQRGQLFGDDDLLQPACSAGCSSSPSNSSSCSATTPSRPVCGPCRSPWPWAWWLQRRPRWRRPVRHQAGRRRWARRHGRRVRLDVHSTARTGYPVPARRQRHPGHRRGLAIGPCDRVDHGLAAPTRGRRGLGWSMTPPGRWVGPSAAWRSSARSPPRAVRRSAPPRPGSTFPPVLRPRPGASFSRPSRSGSHAPGSVGQLLIDGARQAFVASSDRAILVAVGAALLAFTRRDLEVGPRHRRLGRHERGPRTIPNRPAPAHGRSAALPGR